MLTTAADARAEALGGERRELARAATAYVGGAAGGGTRELTRAASNGDIERSERSASAEAGLPPLSWARRRQLALDVARGIEFLHSLSPPMIHRDLKPQNCLLDSTGTLKVTRD